MELFFLRYNRSLKVNNKMVAHARYTYAHVQKARKGKQIF
jgi:hypothetical protein